MALPKSIILGFPKCGTTALATYLNFYPEIDVNREELNFFSNARKISSLSIYKQMFYDSRWGIDKSPTLIYGYENITRLKDTIPDVHIIICVRNPASRFFSDYYYNVYQGIDVGSFRDMLSNADGELYKVFERGFYVKWLQQLFTVFPKEQVTIVKQEDLLANPTKVVNSLTAKYGLSQMRLWPKMYNRSAMRLISETDKHHVARCYYPYNYKLRELTGIDYLDG
jgi:hypothetical protein